MERETKTITTPVANAEVVLKTWLTAREQRGIRAVYLNDLKISPDSEDGKDMDYQVTGNILEKAQDAAIEAVIQSVNGETEGILDKVLDMRTEDFNFIVKEINQVTGGISEEDKKK